MVLPVFVLQYAIPAWLSYGVLGGLWWYFVGLLPRYRTQGKISRWFAAVAAIFVVAVTVPDFTIFLTNVEHGAVKDPVWLCISVLIFLSWFVALDLLWFAARGAKSDAQGTLA